MHILYIQSEIAIQLKFRTIGTNYINTFIVRTHTHTRSCVLAVSLNEHKRLKWANTNDKKGKGIYKKRFQFKGQLWAMLFYVFSIHYAVFAVHFLFDSVTIPYRSFLHKSRYMFGLRPIFKNIIHEKTDDHQKIDFSIVMRVNFSRVLLTCSH